MKKTLITALMLLASSAQATTYYVSQLVGADTNSGLTYSLPLKTITEGLNRAQNANDIVYVRNGTYAEAINISQSNITLSALPGSTPIIDLTSLPGQDWIVAVSIDGNYNKVNGFEIRNVNINKGHVGGYAVQAAGHHNVVSKITAHHTWEQAILLNGDYNTVEDSTIYQADQVNLNGVMAPLGGGWPSAMSAGRNNSPSALTPGITSYATFRRNTSYNNWGEGLSCYETDNCYMTGNIVYDNWALNIYLSDSTDATIARNLAYVSSAPAITTRTAKPAGITLADEVANGTTIPYSANNLIANNCVYNTDFNSFSWTEVPSGLKNTVISNNTVDGGFSTGYDTAYPAITNVNSQIRNNILREATGFSNNIPSTSGLTFSNNNWLVSPPLGASPTDVIGAPQLTRTGTTTPGTMTTNYCRLQSISPNINTGVAVTGVTYDILGAARGTLRDIGAHEYGATLPTLTLSGIAASPVSTSYVTFVWSGSVPNTGVIEYGISPTALNYTKAVTVSSNNQATAISSFSAGQLIYYHIVATSTASGQVVTSPTYSFTMPITN